MSIFVAQLGFGGHEDLLLMAKTVNLAGSQPAGVAEARQSRYCPSGAHSC